ncbi:MAG: hypothetical protein JRI59_06605 [Deltaproteobacteria bacterium]|nr:hypothetical protein [Deltaproteobacteria bacterium]
MLSHWQKHPYLRVGVFFLVALFAVVAVADAAVCQTNIHHDGHCLLPCICCHAVLAIQTGPDIRSQEPVVTCILAPDQVSPVLLPSSIFHPPRV